MKYFRDGMKKLPKTLKHLKLFLSWNTLGKNVENI